MPKASKPSQDEPAVALAELRTAKEALAELTREKHEPIASVGMGPRYPGGNYGADEFADFLREGRSGIRPLPADERRQMAPDPDSDKGPTGERPLGGFLSDIDRFDAAFFSVSPRGSPVHRPAAAPRP
ncbi:beta-ketoacyl synthase N-terminal-like domain-containing protein [Streptomyces olivaceoviridis]|uniref:beta-ketoacyl synthase N-terminal-like domain-containing protein n=1 Tax=Streptomyces olivaceoviridis TaxID=1921 RepID=UPI00331BF2DD